MKTKIIDGKKVIFESSKNIPSPSIIKRVYAKIPDNKRIPVVFETKEQYLNEYIRNQERAKHIKFTPQEIRNYKSTELSGMKNIVSRYTTKHNPFMPARTVFFTDRKITPTQFEQSAYHEYGHELWEKSPKIRRDWRTVNRTSAPTSYGQTDRQEDFAESYMMYKDRGPLDIKRGTILQRDVGRNRTIHPSVRKLFAAQGGTPEHYREYEEGLRENPQLKEFIRKEEIDKDDSSHSMAITWKKTPGRHYKDMTPEEYFEKAGKPPSITPEAIMYKYPADTFLGGVVDKPVVQTVKEFSEDIKDPNKMIEVQAPFVYEPGTQEGRHRVLGAQLAGEKTVPVETFAPREYHSPEISKAFAEKMATKGHRFVGGYDREWEERFASGRPETHMGKEFREGYRETLAEKGLNPNILEPDAQVSKDRIINVPIDQAWSARKRGSVIGDMTPKREPSTMAALKQSIEIEGLHPINITPREYESGEWHEGKHRLIIAKQLGYKEVPVEVDESSKNYSYETDIGMIWRNIRAKNRLLEMMGRRI